MKSPKQAYDTLHAIACEYVRDGVEHPCMLVMFTDSGIVPVKPLTQDGIAGRNELAAIHRKVAELAQGAPVAMIAECWEVDGTRSAEHYQWAERVARGVLPTSDVPEPYRSEAVMFNIRTASGAQFIAVCAIDRAARTLAKPALIDPSDPAPGHAYMGRQIGAARSRDVN